MSDQHPHTGSTDPRVDAALRKYLERVDRGEPIDREEFISRHAEIADALRSFFAAEELFRKIDGACGNDSDLRQRDERLPAAQPGSPMERPAHAEAGAPTLPPRDGVPGAR